MWAWVSRAPPAKRLRNPVEDEAQVGDALHVDRVGEARSEKRRRVFERTLDGAGLGTLRAAQDEVDPRMTVVHGQYDGDDPHSGERGIIHVVTKERTQLIENKTLHAQVPMAGTLILSSHDTASRRPLGTRRGRKPYVRKQRLRPRTHALRRRRIEVPHRRDVQPRIGKERELRVDPRESPVCPNSRCPSIERSANPYP